MKYGVVIFPGSNCDRDMIHTLRNVLQQEVHEIWHKETSLPDFTVEDCVVLPGGFSYGDYLRTGAIARFSPIMKSIVEHGQQGGKIIGICNGFQVLCEAGLLPGVLLRNVNQQFICKNVYIQSTNTKSIFTLGIERGTVLKIPIAHAEGRYYADNDTLQEMRDNDQIVFTYCDQQGTISPENNPNGSVQNIAGICNKEGNIVGMMPHPERAAEQELGNTDGKWILSATLKTRSEQGIH